jgi:hypothetical protein
MTGYQYIYQNRDNLSIVNEKQWRLATLMSSTDEEEKDLDRKYGWKESSVKTRNSDYRKLQTICQLEDVRLESKRNE